MTVRGWILCFYAALAISACAIAPAVPKRQSLPNEADDEQINAALAEIKQHKRGMTIPRANNDCQKMCNLGELICAASERICKIASRYPEEAGLAERCRSSEEDCHTARRECDGCQ